MYEAYNISSLSNLIWQPEEMRIGRGQWSKFNETSATVYRVHGSKMTVIWKVPLNAYYRSFH